MSIRMKSFAEINHRPVRGGKHPADFGHRRIQWNLQQLPDFQIGTTAHVFLEALRAANVDRKEVELVNQAMPAAVTAFISGAVRPWQERRMALDESSAFQRAPPA
jgi:hypothetical protein